MISQDKLERALSIYQVLKDAKANQMAKTREMHGRCEDLFYKVIAILEKAI